MPRGIDGSRDIKDETIQSVDIKNGTLKNIDLASDAAIDQSKISNSGGWISNLASGGLTVTNIDTSSGDVDMTIYEPSNPSDGDNWIVKNNGSSGNTTYYTSYSISLNDGEFVTFTASSGVFYPMLSSHKTIVSQSTFPSTPNLGDECYRTDLDEWYKYNGNIWMQI